MSSIKPINLATWFLWFAIDFAVIASLKKAKRPFELMVVFTVGTGIIALIGTVNYLLGRAVFEWGIAETLVVFAVIVALIIWWNTSDNIGVLATSSAMVIAGIPTWINAYDKPWEQSVVFWTMSGLACLFTYVGSPRTLYDRFMPACGVFANSIILSLALTRYL